MYIKSHSVRQYSEQIVYSIASAMGDPNVLLNLPILQITEPLLKKTCAVLKKFYNTRQKAAYIRYDLHSGNIMIRMLPTGPQLVITDPFV